MSRRSITMKLRSQIPQEERDLQLKNKTKETIIPITSLPFIKYNGKVHYYTTFIGCATACDKLMNIINSKVDDIFVMGFDIEWPFNFQTGSGKTALMQISPNLDECYLFHIFNLKKLPASLIQLLEHPRCRWTGVVVKNDFRKLARDFSGINGDFIVENCVDCSMLANNVLACKRRWSMKDIVARFLKMRINKSNKVRMSKWHILPLSNEQIKYAATDAYTSLKLYYHLKELEVMNTK